MRGKLLVGVGVEAEVAVVLVGLRLVQDLDKLDFLSKCSADILYEGRLKKIVARVFA
jgi:hypothetical protein